MEYKTLPQIFKETASKFRGNVAIQDKDGGKLKAYTFGEIRDSAGKIGDFLLHSGICKNNVSLICPNGAQWVAAYFGILESGSTVVPIDYTLTAEEIANIISDSQSKALFCSKEVLRKIESALGKLPHVKLVVLTNAQAQKEGMAGLRQIEEQDIPRQDIRPEINIDAVASLLYTSGTTARPKGVMLTHKNLCANFQSLNELKICSSKDNVLSILPLHHAYAFTVTLLLPLFSGARITYIHSLRTDAILSIMKETKVTMLVAVPEMLNAILNSIEDNIKRLVLPLRIGVALARKSCLIIYNASGLNCAKALFANIHSRFGGHLRFLVSGGARLEPRVSLGLMSFGFTIFEGYGLTETSPVVALAKKEIKKAAAVGRAINGVNIRIESDNKGSTGEILIYGDNVMKGYYRRDEDTSAVIKNGWFYSGDLGFIDVDGYLYITGRAKDVIVLSSGKNIYPEEIEEHYKKSPFIKDICVIDITQGGVIGLYAVIAPDYDHFKKAREINIAHKIKWEVENLAKNAPSFRRLLGFTIAKEDLPKTALGKVKRYEVRSKYKDAVLQKTSAEGTNDELPPDKEILKDEMALDILGCLKKEFKKGVALGDHLELDLGVDSLMRVNLAACLEKTLNRNIPDEAMSSAYTVRELIENIKGLSTAEAPGRAPEAADWGKILRADPGKEIMEKIRTRANLLEKGLIFSGTFFIKLLCGSLFLLKSRGRQNLPSRAPYIICPNHTSFLDGLLIKASLPYSLAGKIFFLGFDFKFYRLALVRPIIKLAGIIPLAPSENLVEAMQACAFLLKQGKILCIFPEGSRGIEERPQEFKKGVGILTRELNVPAVPTYIKGALAAWPRTQRFPKPHPTKVTFGKAVYSEEIKEPRDNSAYEAIAKTLRDRVEGLLKT
ncbi:MAG: AMP-binding protein [Candidatus Omnitrophica bacterium]|nr:AMP-binding protein [Candidatus Omnitrophota bacterium]